MKILWMALLTTFLVGCGQEPEDNITYLNCVIIRKPDEIKVNARITVDMDRYSVTSLDLNVNTTEPIVDEDTISFMSAPNRFEILGRDLGLDPYINLYVLLRDSLIIREAMMVNGEMRGATSEGQCTKAEKPPKKAI